MIHFRKRSAFFLLSLLSAVVLNTVGPLVCPAQAQDLYVVSNSTNQVLRYNGTTGAFVGTFVAAGSGGLSNAIGLTFGPDGNLYVSSGNTDQVMRYDGATGAPLPSAGHSGAVFAAVGQFTGPGNLTFGPDGNLYVSGGLSDKVMRFDGTTGTPLPSAGNPGAVFAFGSGLGIPTGLTFGSDGNLYVSSYAGSSSRIVRYNGTTGAPLPSAGNTGAIFASGGGLNDPYGLAFGADGNLYISSYQNSQILRYNGITGAFMNTFVGTGSGGMRDPIDLTFGPDGNLYVSGGLNQVLRYERETGAPLPSPGNADAVFVASGSGGLMGSFALTFKPTLASSVPEPGLLSLLVGFGVTGVALLRRRRRKESNSNHCCSQPQRSGSK